MLFGGSRYCQRHRPGWHPSFKSSAINRLILSRDLSNTQTLEYDLTAVCSTDLDPTGNFLLVGLSNGAADLQGIQDPNYGTLENVSRMSLSHSNIHRVQWSPGPDQFFSLLDNQNLYFVDPVEMRPIDRYSFNITTNWSDWNLNDPTLIAVCGNQSQVRFVDIRCGSAVQTIILGSKSRLGSHRATRCIWSKQDINCLIVGDNEGQVHLYDTRQSTRPFVLAGEDSGQISGLQFTSDNNSIITSHGTENKLIQWTFDKCTLKSWPTKFKKKPKESIQSFDETNDMKTNGEDCRDGKSSRSRKQENKKKTSAKTKGKKSSSSSSKSSKKMQSLSIDAYIRCQFYVTDRHIFCPVPSRTRKSKEIYIYDISSGYRVKTLKADAILCQGVNSISGLLPDSLTLYVGGRNRLRVWTLNEDYQRSIQEKIAKYHTSRWDSDDER